MKNNKLLLFVLLPLISLNIVCIYLFSSFPAYSKQNNTPEPRLANSKCDQKYPESIYPEAKAYCDGLAETKKTEPEEIWRNLTAIVEHNKKLIWEDGNINGRVLVLTWTSWNGYEKNLGKFMSLERDVWVTAVPDLREFCTQYSNTKNINNKVTLPYRINQLLGLTPEKPEKNQRRKLVEIWVEPKYLFRPTPDPEITDREAELDFSRSNLFVSVSNKYKYWFFHQWMTNNYPWSRLGYTYDWGNNSHWETIDPNRPNNVGLSEFIIRKGSSIKVHSISKAENYCQSDLNVIGIRD